MQKRSKLIYFHIDELKRDAVVASALRLQLERDGHRLVYGNRALTRWLHITRFFFDVIVVPRPHFLTYYHQQKWLKWDNQFVMLSTENIGIICKDEPTMARALLERDYFEGNESIVQRINAFCVWGRAQANALINCAPELTKKVHVVGHPRYDNLCVTPRTPRIRNRTRVGILLRANSINDYYGRSALDTFCTLFDDHFQYEYFNRTTNSYLVSRRAPASPAENIAVQALDTGVLLKIISRLNDPRYILSIRHHPRESNTAWNKVLKYVDPAIRCDMGLEPMTTWLSNQDVVVGSPTTVFYDASVAGVTPISIEYIDPRRRPLIGELWEDNNRLSPYIEKPKSIEDLVSKIDACEQHISADAYEVLHYETNYPECRQSIRAIADVLDQLNYLTRKSRPKTRAFLVEYIFMFITLMLSLKSKIRSEELTSSSFLLTRNISSEISNLVTPDRSSL